MLAYGMLLATRCRLISINSSLVRSLLAACWSVIAAYCSSLATRLIVPLASRSSTYAAPGILLLIACYTLPSRQLFSLKILLTCRFSLCTIDNLLLTGNSLLFARRLLLGSCFLPVGPLLSRCSPLAVHCSLAQCLLHAIGYYLLAAHGS